MRAMFWRIECWRCGADYWVYTVVDDEGVDLDEMHDADKIAYEPAVMAQAKVFAAERGMVLGIVAERYSRAMDLSSMSFGCPSCDALCGDWFIFMEASLEQATDEPPVLALQPSS